MRSSLLLLGSGSIAFAGVISSVDPIITPAPTIKNIDLRQRQDIDLASLAQVLATGVPKSIVALALTNVPAVSRMLWSQFLDDNTPTWFTALPTDIQAYLSGEFGPSTAASKSASTTPSSSEASTTSSMPTASVTAAANTGTSNNNNGGLPLWAIILIGVLIPLFVLGLIALLFLCCLRRRRHQHHSDNSQLPSRTPTPAFLSTAYRKGPANPPGEQHVPLRSGHVSRELEPDQGAMGSNYHSSSSEEYRTPPGGPSYENIPPPTTTSTNNLRRSSRHSSRHSSTSLHSVPEVPEPMHNPHYGSPPMPIPPRSPHRSRDFSQEGDLVSSHALKKSHRISPMENSYSHYNPGADSGPYHNESIYTGGHHPYPDPHRVSGGDHRPYSDPFTDPASYRQSDYSYSNGHTETADQDPGHFLGYHGEQQDPESNWPLRASEDRGSYRPTGAGRTRSYDRYYDKEKVYEM